MSGVDRPPSWPCTKRHPFLHCIAADFLLVASCSQDLTPSLSNATKRATGHPATDCDRRTRTPMPKVIHQWQLSSSNGPSLLQRSLGTGGRTSR
jgi:hypothetical protein